MAKREFQKFRAHYKRSASVIVFNDYTTLPKDIKFKY